MKDLIESLKITKDISLVDIEGMLFDVEDYSSNYYSIKRMGCDSYCRAATEIYEYLQSV